MGTFKARIGVSDGNGGPTHWVNALVDTGATYTVLPGSLCNQLGIQPRKRLEFTFADGRRKTLPVGDAYLTVAGADGPNPVVFGEVGQYLLGATALQVLGLIPDTTHHKLIPAPSLPL